MQMKICKMLSFFFLAVLTGCATSMSQSSYFKDVIDTKTTLNRKMFLCELSPKRPDYLVRILFNQKGLYYLDTSEPLSGICLDSPVELSEGATIELKKVVFHNHFDGHSTHVFGYIHHPQKNEMVPFETSLYSKGHNGACGNPNAPFGINKTSCDKYFTNLNKFWN